jgi:perosamine synthetase
MEKIKWPTWPNFGEEEYSAVERVIRSNQLFASTEVRSFESQFSQYLGCRYALGVGNATQGLHLALAALKVGVGDEVIVTSYSWISTASCILMQNAVPIFCDIEQEALGACPADIERKITHLTKAIIITHMFGYPARIQEIVKLANAKKIPVIEDASHAHGAELDGAKIGTFGKVSVFSLHQRKSLSAGDGGIVCTSDKMIHDKIYKLRSFGDDELSYNYRMSEFAAALGQVGLRKLDQHNKIRKKNARQLSEQLRDCSSLTVRFDKYEKSSVFYAVLISIRIEIEELDRKLELLQKQGIPIRKTWSPLHLHPHFNPSSIPSRGLPWRHPMYEGSMRHVVYKDSYLPVVTEHCPNRVLELYVHPPTSDEDIAFSVAQLKNYFE